MTASFLCLYIGVLTATTPLALSFAQDPLAPRPHLSLTSKIKPASCQFQLKRSKLCAAIEWIKKPVHVAIPTEKDQASFTLRFWDQSKGSEKGPFMEPIGEPKVSLWMPEMDHGSEATQITRDGQVPGVFHVERVLFSMSGDWEIKISLYKSGQLLDQAKIAYRFE